MQNVSPGSTPYSVLLVVVLNQYGGLFAHEKGTSNATQTLLCSSTVCTGAVPSALAASKVDADGCHADQKRTSATPGLLRRRSEQWKLDGDWRLNVECGHDSVRAIYGRIADRSHGQRQAWQTRDSM